MRTQVEALKGQHRNLDLAVRGLQEQRRQLADIQAHDARKFRRARSSSRLPPHARAGGGAAVRARCACRAGRHGADRGLGRALRRRGRATRRRGRAAGALTGQVVAPCPNPTLPYLIRRDALAKSDEKLGRQADWTADFRADMAALNDDMAVLRVRAACRRPGAALRLQLSQVRRSTRARDARARQPDLAHSPRPSAARAVRGFRRRPHAIERERRPHRAR
jgi:hypothetical protein